jgi:hypothetical protein
VALVVAQPVVREVVDAAERKRRPLLVALAGVVVDHVEHDLEVVLVQRLHHRLELAHRVLHAEARVGREEAEGVVAPVVLQPLRDQRAVVDERLHRQQLERGHAERAQVVDHLLLAHAEELALVLRRHVGVALGVAAHVHLVDHPLVAAARGIEVVAPVEAVVDHLAFRHAARALALVEGQVFLLVPDGVAEMRVAPVDLAHDRLGIGIEEQLVGVEAVALLGLVRPVHAVAVEGAGLEARHVPVPDEVGALAQGEALHLLLPGLVEQAQLHLLGVARVDREVDALVVRRGAEGIGGAGPELGSGMGCGGLCHVLASSRSPRRGISIQSGRLAIS